MSIPECAINNNYCKVGKLTKGLCKRHYDSKSKYNDPIRVDIKSENRKVIECKITSCLGIKSVAGYCEYHYYRLNRYGDPLYQKRLYRDHELYATWANMKQRCENNKVPVYKHYGGRGIKVCDSWSKSFKNFLTDMGERPKGTTLDRIDNNGNYEPSNCRWSTWTQQRRNTRINRSNSSGFRGVTWDKSSWAARISVDKKLINIGYFKNKKDAINARIEAENIYWKN